MRTRTGRRKYEPDDEDDESLEYESLSEEEELYLLRFLCRCDDDSEKINKNFSREGVGAMQVD
jgi:hypothetical protein